MTPRAGLRPSRRAGKTSIKWGRAPCPTAASALAFGDLMPRENWFFAFPIDGAFVRELPEVPAGFRRFHSEDVHLTLAFLGGCGEGAAARALSALDERLSRDLPRSIDVSLGGVVPMGPRGRDSAL